MHNQRRLVNLTEHGKAILRGDRTPFADGFQLSNSRLPGHRLVSISRAELQPFEIGVSCCLACVARREERIHEQAYLIVQFVDRKLGEGHTFTTTWPRAEQNDPSRQVWKFKGKLLRDHPAEGKSNDVEAVQVKRVAETDEVLRHRCDGRRSSTSRTADTGIVKDDDVAVRCKAVRDLWVPIVHVCREVIEEQERRRSALSKAPVRDPDISCLNELGGSSFVHMLGHRWTLLICSLVLTTVSPA